MYRGKKWSTHNSKKILQRQDSIFSFQSHFLPICKLGIPSAILVQVFSDTSTMSQGQPKKKQRRPFFLYHQSIFNWFQIPPPPPAPPNYYSGTYTKTTFKVCIRSKQISYNIYFITHMVQYQIHFSPSSLLRQVYNQHVRCMSVMHTVNNHILSQVLTGTPGFLRFPRPCLD